MNATIVLCFMIYLLLGIASGLPAWLRGTMGVPVELFDAFRMVEFSALSPEAADQLEEYKLDNGEYPDTDKTNDLYKALYYNGASVTPPEKIYVSQLDPDNNELGWTEGTEANAKIVDPWGKEYIYRRGDHENAKNPDFDLLSVGKDGLTSGNASDPTTADDIDNF